MYGSLDNIKTIRKRIGITQSELAKKANVSQSLIAKIEAGRLDPTYSKANGIFEVLNSLSKRQTPTAKDIMQTKIISVHIDEPVNEIIHKMRKYNISQLPVINKYVIGLVSEASVLEKLKDGFKDGRDVCDLKAKDVMAEAAPMISEDTDVEIVSNILKQHSIIIVSKHGELSGVITKADVLKNIYKF